MIAVATESTLIARNRRHDHPERLGVEAQVMLDVLGRGQFAVLGSITDDQ